MKDAVIVSAARTPIGKAYRGAFNNLEAPSLSSHAVKAAVERAGVDPAGDGEIAVRVHVSQVSGLRQQVGAEVHQEIHPIGQAGLEELREVGADYAQLATQIAHG